jgi:hypothetical protein
MLNVGCESNMKKTIIILLMGLLVGAAHAFPPTNSITKCEFAFKNGTNALHWITVDLDEGKTFIGSMPYFGNLKDWNPWKEQNLPKSTRISPAHTYYYFRMTTTSGTPKTASFPRSPSVVHYRGLGIKHVPKEAQGDVLRKLKEWETDWAKKYDTESKETDYKSRDDGIPTPIHFENVKVTVEKDKPSTICADGRNRDGTPWAATSIQTIATLTTSNLSATITITINDGTLSFWSVKGTTFTASIPSSLFQEVFVSKKMTRLNASEFKNRKGRTEPKQALASTSP